MEITTLFSFPSKSQINAQGAVTENPGTAFVVLHWPELFVCVRIGIFKASPEPLDIFYGYVIFFTEHHKVDEHPLDSWAVARYAIQSGGRWSSQSSLLSFTHALTACRFPLSDPCDPSSIQLFPRLDHPSSRRWKCDVSLMLVQWLGYQYFDILFGFHCNQLCCQLIASYKQISMGYLLAPFCVLDQLTTQLLQLGEKYRHKTCSLSHHIRYGVSLQYSFLLVIKFCFTKPCVPFLKTPD